MKCIDCLCLDCENEYNTDIKNCHCPTCLEEDWDNLGWCKKYRELEKNVIEGDQQSLFERS